MVKRGLISFCVASLLLLTAVVVGTGWVAGTNAGTRWLLKSVGHWTPVKLSAKVVDGRLAGSLRLEDFSVDWPSGAASGEELALKWHPWQLLEGRVAIERVLVRGADLRTRTTEVSRQPSSPWRWPKLPRWAALLRGTLKTLTLERCAWHRTSQRPFVIERLAAGLDWRFGRLKVLSLAVSMPQGKLTGTTDVAFPAPAVASELTFEPTSPPAGLTRFTLRVRLHPSAGAGQFAGPVEVTASGNAQTAFSLRTELRLVSGTIRLTKLRLERPGRAERLTGDLDVSGHVENYHGRFALRVSGAAWQSFAASGHFSGTPRSLTSHDLSAAWLGGQVNGKVDFVWNEGLHLVATLNGTGLNPGTWDRAWPGRLNFEMTARLERRPGAALQSRVQGRLLKSTLRGYPLSGTVDATLSDDQLRIGQLALDGPGLKLSAHGRLAQRMDVSLAIDQLERFVPTSKGRLRTDGWLAWRKGQFWGDLAVDADRLAVGNMQVATLTGRLRRPAAQASFELSTQAHGVRSGQTTLTGVELRVAGVPGDHRGRFSLSSARGEASGSFAGRYAQGKWQGELRQLTLTDADLGHWRLAAASSLEVDLSGVSFSALHLTSRSGEDVDAAGRLRFSPFAGEVQGRWRLRLERLSPWTDGWRLAGLSSGELHAIWDKGGALDLTARATASGRVDRDGLAWQVKRGEVSLSWTAAGLTGSTTMALADGGHIEASIASSVPGRLGIPRSGHLTFAARDFPLATLQPLLHSRVRLQGKLAAVAEGDWSSGGKAAFTGSLQVAGGLAMWRDEQGEVRVPVEAGQLKWAWRDAVMTGDVNLTLRSVGRLAGHFRLPIPARLPLAPDAEGPVSGDLTANVAEHGLVTAFFPGMIQESSGTLTLQARLGGTWEHPVWNGRLALHDAAAVVPAAGIHLRGIALQARLAGEEVVIDSFSARSGKGRLNGSGRLALAGWKVKSFSGSLKGKDFELIHLPELEVTVDPDLRVSGTPRLLKVRGRVVLPDVLVTGAQPKSLVTPSSDVVVVDAPARSPLSSPVSLDAQVEVELGKSVFVQLNGVDAQLSGKVSVRASDRERIAGVGEIQVVKGTYSAYGVKLKITRGRLLFAGGPIDQPSLDVLALRTVGDIQAGVQVSGTPRAPQVKLTSTPSLPDTDILSYIVLGHPLGQGGGQASLLMLAAGGLLSKGESAVLQDRIKRHLGLDVLEIQSGSTGASSTGQTIPPPPGTATTTETSATGTLPSTVVTIGKYISPDLYVSLGRSLFTNTNQAGLRYTLSRRWEIESKMGSAASGVDLYYKIEFK